MAASEYRLTRISKTEKSGTIRDIPVVGVLPKGLPTVGDNVHIICAPVVEGASGRLVSTSKVVAIDGNEFVTESGSLYELEEVGPVE